MGARFGISLGVALILAGTAAGDAHACQNARRAAATGPHYRRAPLIIGDSTMIYATPYLGRRGLQADAHGCRQFSQGTSMLTQRRRAGTLPRLAILALGANGPVTSSAVNSALRIVGPTRVLGLVTPRNVAATKASMRRAAHLHPDRVLLIDWAAFSAGHGSWFGGDGLHVNDTGARAFAALVARRAQVLMPPRRRLAVPRSSRRTRACGVTHRGGATLRVHIVRGGNRITCRRARQIARRPPLVGTRGWRTYDWRDARSGPWRDVYARADRRVVFGTVRVRTKRLL